MIEDKTAFFKECHRVLKPNGVLAIIGHPITFHSSKDSQKDIALNAAIDKVIHRST
jgi:predicted methyltransferase